MSEKDKLPEAAADIEKVLTTDDKGVDEPLPVTEGRRQVKPTQRALEANYAKQCKARKAKLGQLTSKRNVLQALMVDDRNVELVKQEYNEFN